MEHERLIEVKNMYKNFGPTKALRGVDVSFYRGEIRGLVGENGSGKSTITSIISGMQKATSGEVFYKGDPWNPDSMVEAQKAGISMVLQEANTIPNCTVAENIFAGRFDEFSRFGMVNMRKVNEEAQKMLDSFGITHIKAADNINRYGFEDRKLIEIVRCVSEDTEIFVVDETTTALSLEGRQLLYKLIRQLKEKGKSVIFISHDMDEILEQCTDLTVLRDGEIIGHLSREDMDKPNAEQVIRLMMVGREIGDAYYREDYDISHKDAVALELSHVTFGPIRDFSLKLHEGEIIGFGGLSGCGMHEIGRLAFGLEKPEQGSVERKGTKIKGCFEAIKSGIGYISKNRDSEALILEGSIQDNITLPSENALSKGGFISPASEKRLADQEIEKFLIKCGSGKQWVNTLSGGNKQKVSFAKWTAKGSDVIIMDCPTRGVDIGVKQFMYALIADMKKQGKAVLLISEEMAELIGMADKILIMKDFQVSKEFERNPELSEADMIEYMIWEGRRMEWLKKHIYDIAAYAGLVVTFILFLIFSGDKLSYNTATVLQSGAAYAIIALGSVFVYSMGFMDVSVGQQVGVYAILMIMITNRIGGAAGVCAGFLVILALALVCGAFNGAVAVWLKLPSIVTSLFLMFFFTGAQLLLMEGTGTSSISISTPIKPQDRDMYNLMLAAAIIVVAIVVTCVFKFTKLGKYTRAIGANETTAAQCGINTTKWKVIAYMAFGVTVAIGSFIMLTRTGSAGKGTGSGYAMDIMICLILGGMPLSGGMRSKVSSALIGTFTYVLLTNDLTTMGIDLNMINFVKAVIFILIILVTCRKKDVVLPR